MVQDEMTESDVERIKQLALVDINIEDVESPVLRRLIEEVRVPEGAPDKIHGYNRHHDRYNRAPGSTPYNRHHNRHNRGR